MRKIKFRGKTLDMSSTWVYGQLVICKNNDYQIGRCEKYGDVYYRNEVFEKTIGQYIGLKDKDGQEIYEGDIVQEEYFNTKLDRTERIYDKYKVEFKEERGGYYPFACGDGCGCCENETISTENVKVIGNIYDNPELLEKN